MNRERWQKFIFLSSMAGVNCMMREPIGAILADPDTRRALADLGVEIAGSSPAEFSAYIAREIPKWTAVVKASGAQLD